MCVDEKSVGPCESLTVEKQVFESSARLKLELEFEVSTKGGAKPFREKFSLLSRLCFIFLVSLLVTGTHLYIFMVVSPIVTHFFSQWRTFSILFITFLMSSLALLRVSARIDRDIVALLSSSFPVLILAENGKFLRTYSISLKHFSVGLLIATKYLLNLKDQKSKL